MAKRHVITLPDPVLRQVSVPVETVDAAVRTLMDDMLETMYDAPGIGLAAVQVGVPRRVIVLDVAGDDEAPAPLKLVNPRIVTASEARRVYEEGCLSIPDTRIEIERPAGVTVAYVDEHGQTREIAAEGLLATALQHEIDHLDGRLIIDYLSRLKRDIVIRKFRKLARGEAAD
jgi:peptide deformylase